MIFTFCNGFSLLEKPAPDTYAVLLLTVHGWEYHSVTISAETGRDESMSIAPGDVRGFRGMLIELVERGEVKNILVPISHLFELNHATTNSAVQNSIEANTDSADKAAAVPQALCAIIQARIEH